jgi:hypothetical protein
MLLSGINVILPPIADDLVKLLKIKEEESKSNPKNLKPQEAGIPLREIPLSPEIMKYSQDHFLEFDFLVMCMLITFPSFLIGQTVKIMFPGQMESNFSFYMLVMFIFMVMWYMFKDSIIPFTFADE